VEIDISLLPGGIVKSHTLAASMTVFLIFFGAALLDALKFKQWISALFWLLIGALFFVLGWRKHAARHV
jgi:hypothetical protein